MLDGYVYAFKNSNSTLSGWATYDGGLFMTDTYNKKKFENLWRKKNNLKGKRGITFMFDDSPPRR